MSPVGFEPTIPASERLQTHALDRAATGTGSVQLSRPKHKCSRTFQKYCNNLSDVYLFTDDSRE